MDKNTLFNTSREEFRAMSQADQEAFCLLACGDWKQDSGTYTYQIRPQPDKQLRESRPFVSRELRRVGQRKKWTNRSLSGTGEFIIWSVIGSAYKQIQSLEEMKAEERVKRQMANEARRDERRKRNQISKLQKRTEDFSPLSWLENTVPDEDIEPEEIETESKLEFVSSASMTTAWGKQEFSAADWAND